MTQPYSSYVQPVDPMRCHDHCLDTGQQCDLQPRHGGNMHSAVDEQRRYWWRDSDGHVERFRVSVLKDGSDLED